MYSKGKRCVCSIFKLNCMNNPVIQNYYLCHTPLSWWMQSLFYPKHWKCFCQLHKDKTKIQLRGTDFSVYCVFYWFLIFILLYVVQHILPEYQSLNLTYTEQKHCILSSIWLKDIQIAFLFPQRLKLTVMSLPR